MLSEYRTGAITSFDGGVNPGRLDRQGSLAVCQGGARFRDAVSRGNMFLAANQAGQSLSVLSGTVTGFYLQNPFGNTKYFILYEVGFLRTSAANNNANCGLQLAFHPFTAAAITHTGTETPRNCNLGFGAASTALVDNSSSGASVPFAIANIWQSSVSATATSGIPSYISYRADGMFALLPGVGLSMSGLGTTIAGATHMIWEEVPLPV